MVYTFPSPRNFTVIYNKTSLHKTELLKQLLTDFLNLNFKSGVVLSLPYLIREKKCIYSKVLGKKTGEMSVELGDEDFHPK